MERYEVGHPDIGLADTFPTVRQAEEYIYRRSPGYTLYDRMAHRGCPELWTWDGTVLVVTRRK